MLLSRLIPGYQISKYQECIRFSTYTLLLSCAPVESGHHESIKAAFLSVTWARTEESVSDQHVHANHRQSPVAKLA